MSEGLPQALIEGSRDDASAALGAYMNGVFHQDQHYPSTWTAVAPLVALLRSRSPVRAEVMTAIGMLVPSKQLNDVTPESFFWKSDENENSVLSVNAVKAARSELERALDDDEVELRCATAWTLSLLKPESEPALRARLAVETDERAYTSLVMALGEGPGDSDVERVLRARSPLDDVSAAAFGRLLCAEPTPWLRFENGLLSSFAARALGRLGPAEPQTFDLLRVAHAAAGSLETRAALEKLLGWLVFGDRRWGRPLRRAELDARMTAQLPLLWSELQHPPRGTDEGIAAFLDGDSVLDEVLQMDGVTAPLCEHVWALCDQQGWDQFDAPKLKSLCRVALETLSPARCFELATALLSDELPYLKLYCKRIIWRQLLPVATHERVVAWVQQLKAALTPNEEHLGYLLLNGWLPAGLPPPPEFDRVVPAVLFGFGIPARPFNGAHLFRWLEAFPPARRAALVARSSDFEQLAPLCEKEALGHAVLEAFLAPDCKWAEDTAHQRLKCVDLEQLGAAAVPDSRRRVVDTVLKEGKASVAFTLTLTHAGDQVRCALSSGASVQVSEVTAASLAPLLPELRVKARRTVTLAGDVSNEIEYAVFLLLGALLRPVTVVDRRGATMQST